MAQLGTQVHCRALRSAASPRCTPFQRAALVPPPCIARRSWVCRFRDSDDERQAPTQQRDRMSAEDLELLQRLEDETKSNWLMGGEERSVRRFYQLGELSRDNTKLEVSPFQPAFTRWREVMVGRAAMAGFFAACFWEAMVPGHPGILQQVSNFTGLDLPTTLLGFTLLGTFNLFGGAAPWSPTYDAKNQRDVSKRLLNPRHQKRVFGVSTWGFNKANELLHGRLAMLGFAAALVQEARMGGAGPLAQVAHYLGVLPTDAFYSDVVSYGGGLITLALLVAGFFGKNNGLNYDKHIY